MAVLKSKFVVIPEKSEVTVQPILREIPIEISGFGNVDISSNDNGVTIKSSVNEIKMYFNTSEDRNITIPDLAEPLSGIITLDDDTPVIELRNIPIDEARALILEYITEHCGAKTSDIIFGLALNVDLVLGILQELNEKEIMPVETQ